MFTGTGKLVYYPSWWLIVYADDQIGEYYRHLIFREHPSLVLNPPKHGAHITVIAGKYDIPLRKEFWNKYHENEIEFGYFSDIGTDGQYYWLPVECSKIEDIRSELGLPSKSPIPWHLTIGNTK
jgi:hypothetical protein